MTPTAQETATRPPDQGAPGPVIASDPPAFRLRAWWAVIKVIELRLRFVALMAVTGLAFAYGETIWNRYEKWTRPLGGRVAAAAGVEFFCPMHPNVVLDQPATCPACGMLLSRRKK